jgi:uncharacterized RDD family membrane protein YckC
MSDAPQSGSGLGAPVAYSGAWRRLGAFCIDGLVLGIIGIALGAVAFARLAALGPWGRLLGFVIAVAYFGVLESRVGGGRTLGKRLLGIRVVDHSGHALSLAQALFRSTIFFVPYFLNGLMLGADSMIPWVAMVLSILVFGLGFSILYLLLFNLPTRQSVHDLATGAFVVKAPASAPLPTPLRRVHKIVIAVAVALSLVLPLGGLWIASRLTFLAPILRVGRTLDAQSHVVSASVNEGTRWSSFNGSVMHKTTMLSASVVMRRWPADPKSAAASFASILLRDVPGASTRDVVSVQLAYGYDIGIARAWRYMNYSYTPTAWMRLESPRTTIH